MKITVKRGLSIPLAGRPEGGLRPLPKKAAHVALNLSAFDAIPFKVHVRVGDRVQIGEPLVENKNHPGQMFVSPAGGVVAEIRRGLKRGLLAIVIEVGESEEEWELGGLDLAANREEIISFFMRRGLFPHIHLRPFNLIPDPALIPRDIFVTAYETLPFNPSYERQIEGKELYFKAGLETLQKLTSGSVHLAYDGKGGLPIFTEVQGVETIQVFGPHPAGSCSLHIHKKAPISQSADYVWSLTALDAVIIGKMVLEGRYHIERVIAVAGNGFSERQRGFYQGRVGLGVQGLLEGEESPAEYLISGDPLTGEKVEATDFLGFYHTTLTALPLEKKREMFHFFRVGLKKFTATRAYFSKETRKEYPFTTNQHGEERAFIDGDVYQRVMPMRLPVMPLIKALIAEDYELAIELGLLEVVPEDFALTAFICPSKIEMIAVVKQGLLRCREG